MYDFDSVSVTYDLAHPLGFRGEFKWHGETGFALVQREVLENLLKIAGFVEATDD